MTIIPKELFIGEIRPYINAAGSTNERIEVTADTLTENPQSDVCDRI